MDNQEALGSQDPMLHQHLSNSHKAKDVKLASQLRTALQDHPAQQEDPDSQELLAVMLMVVDVDHPDLQDQQDLLVDQERMDSQAGPDNQARFVRFPADRDHPVHPDPMDSLVAQDSQEVTAIQDQRDHPAHPETMELQERQATQEDQEDKDRREDRAIRELAIIALHHALLQDIKTITMGHSTFSFLFHHS